MNGTTPPPIESSVQYSSSMEQPLPEITFTTDDSSPPESKGHDSSFREELSIDLTKLSVGSMSISPSNRDIVLATRKGLYIVDLEHPYEIPRELHHLTKWEVADVQWNPHQSRDRWVASTSNQKGLIWNLESATHVEHILHAHSRAISDINWHPLIPDDLATCSVDTYIHIWDLRKPRRPARSFCAWTAGATQVKFNRKNEFLLASSHDTNLLIWDTRKGSLPVAKTKAHETKIYGIDWSRTSADEIITCSLDKSVKFWNIQDFKTSQGVIYTNSPVWRARHTPVGNGIITMPQRSEKNLYLWNRENLKTHVYAFKGHEDEDVVKEFVWRTKSNGDSMIDDREFQLITWTKDKILRLWPINDQLLKAIGHERGKPIHQTDQLKPTGRSTFTFRNPPNDRSTLSTSAPYPSLRVISGSRTNTNSNLRPSGASTGGGNITGTNMLRERRSLSPLLWMQVVKTVRPSGEIGNTEDNPRTMQEEIVVLSKKFPNVKFEQIDEQKRIWALSLHGPWSDSGNAFIRINVEFPQKYPESEIPPDIVIQKTGMISIMHRTRMLKELNNIARSHVTQRRPCLEACIRYLLGEHPQEDSQERYGKYLDDENYLNFIRKTSYDKNLNYILGDRDDSIVPFPKVCGAKFCATGKLVCFFSSIRSVAKPSYIFNHPRAFDNWEEYKMILRLPGLPRHDDDDDDDINIHSLLKRELQNIIPFEEISKTDRTGYASHIYDFSEWMPINRKLAKEYTLHGDDPVEICKHNARIAEDNNRPDLKQVWLLASLILSQTVPTKWFKDSNYDDTSKRSESENGSDSSIDEEHYEIFNLDWGFHGRNWGFHPCGRTLVKDLLDHFSSIGDIQTAAMLSCVFRQPFPPYRKIVRPQEFLFSTMPDFIPGNMYSNISENTDYFNQQIRYSEKRNTYNSFPGGTLVESYNSSKSSWGNQINQMEFSYGTPPTPSAYIYGQSEGTGRSIMMPLVGHTPHHQRRSTFCGTSKELVSSVSTTASSPRNPRKSPAANSFNKFDNYGLGKYYGNERHIETSSRLDKRSCDVTLILCNLEEFDDENGPIRVSLLDDKIETNVRHDQLRLAYAELLYHWGLFEARAELLKFMKFVTTAVGSPLGERDFPLEIDIHCFQCGSELKGARMCRTCNRMRVGIKCSICRQTVRGLSNFCVLCNHGGHTNHLREWFEKGNDECPSGCGCHCKKINGGF